MKVRVEFLADPLFVLTISIHAIWPCILSFPEHFETSYHILSRRCAHGSVQEHQMHKILFFRHTALLVRRPDSSREVATGHRSNGDANIHKEGDGY
jgi:hypothetical protein